jgi:hypothetical protein
MQINNLANYLLIGCLIALFLTSCKSSGSETIDPVTTWPGSYTGQMVSKAPDDQPYEFDIDVVIKAGSKSGEVTLDISSPVIGPFVDSWTGTIKGTEVTLPTIKSPDDPDTEIKGSGTLSGKNLKLVLQERRLSITPVVSVTHTITASQP